MRKSRTKTGCRPLRAGIAVGATVAAVVAGTALPAYAGTFTTSTTQVAAVTGGTTLYLTGTGTAFDSPVVSLTTYSDLAVRFITPSTATCPTTYAGTSATSGAAVVSAGLATAGSATDAYVTVPPGLVHNTTYGLCLYGTNSATNADLVATGGSSPVFTGDTASNTVTAVNMGALGPSTGVAGDKITTTAGHDAFTLGSYSTQFVNNSSMTCPTTYSTTTSQILTATTVKTSVRVLTVTVPTSPALTAGTPYVVCHYAGSTVGSSVLAARSRSSFAVYGTTALPSVAMSPVGGSSGTATAITLTAPSPIFTGSAPAVLFTTNACPATYTAGSNNLEPYAPTVSPAVSKISNSKIATTVPTAIIVGGLDATTPWNVCAYASTSGALVAAPSTYSVAPVLNVTGAQFSTGAASPTNTLSGPSQGGQQITVTGLTGIPSAAAVAAGARLTAMLGNSPITNITPIDATSFSGVTGPNVAGDAQLSVTTAAGTKTTTAAAAGGTRYYTFTYGTTVTPNTAPSGSSPVLDITGAGFSNIATWANTANGVASTASGYVILTNNAYYGQTFNNLNIFATAPVSYCNGVLPISDTEIICTLNLAARIDSVSLNAPTIGATAVPAGSYTVTVVNEGNDIDANEYSIVSSGSTFTVAPF